MHNGFDFMSETSISEWSLENNEEDILELSDGLGQSVFRESVHHLSISLFTYQDICK
jgi:hypothetical protein